MPTVGIATFTAMCFDSEPFPVETDLSLNININYNVQMIFG